jgi:ABC-type molybdenum transport system ATPase subunit/photorepair protein PhrA
MQAGEMSAAEETPDASAPLLDISGLTIAFGARTVVDGLSFTLAAGRRWASWANPARVNRLRRLR